MSSVDGLADGLADGPADELADGLVDELVDELTDGLVDELVDELTDGLVDELADALVLVPAADSVAVGEAVVSSFPEAVEEEPGEPATAAEVAVADGDAVEGVLRPVTLVVPPPADDEGVAVALGEAVASSSAEAVDELLLEDPATAAGSDVVDDEVEVAAGLAEELELVAAAVGVAVEVAEGEADEVAVGEPLGLGAGLGAGVGVGVGVEVATTAGTSPAAVTLSSSSCARRPIRDSVAASAAIAITAATTQRALLPFGLSPLPFSPLSPPPSVGPAAGPSGLDTVTPQVSPSLNKIRL